MRRTASEILRDLEIRVAHLEVKQLTMDHPHSQRIFDLRPQEQKAEWQKSFKKNLNSFIVAIEEYADAIGLERFKFGHLFLKNSDEYFSDVVKNIIPKGLSEWELYRYDMRLTNRIVGDPMAVMLALVWKTHIRFITSTLHPDNRAEIDLAVKKLLGPYASRVL